MCILWCSWFHRHPSKRTKTPKLLRKLLLFQEILFQKSFNMISSHRLKEYCQSWRLIRKYYDHSRGDEDSCDIADLTHLANNDDNDHNNNLNHNYQALQNNKKNNLTKRNRSFWIFLPARISLGDKCKGWLIQLSLTHNPIRSLFYWGGCWISA